MSFAKERTTIVPARAPERSRNRHVCLERGTLIKRAECRLRVAKQSWSRDLTSVIGSAAFKAVDEEFCEETVRRATKRALVSP